MKYFCLSKIHKIAVVWHDRFVRIIFQKNLPGEEEESDRPRRINPMPRTRKKDYSTSLKSDVLPPSTTRSWQFTKLPSSLARYSAA